MTEFWFPIFLTVILVLVLGFSIIGIKRGYDAVAAVAWSCILLIFLLIVWSVNYCSSIGEIADMKAFVSATKSAYEYTITSTQEVEIKAISLAEPSASEILNVGELAYLKLGSQASERIKEFRAKVEWYNKTLERYRQYNFFWFTQGFIANIPENMMPIILK